LLDICRTITHNLDPPGRLPESQFQASEPVFEIPTRAGETDLGVGGGETDLFLILSNGAGFFLGR